MKRTFYAALLGLLASFASAQLPPVEFSVFRSGDQCQIKKEENRVILNAGQFQTYWKEAFGQNLPVSDVNFASEFLVAVHLGERTTAGYKVMVQSMDRARASEIEVTVLETIPNGLNAAVMTSPFEIVRVKRPAAGDLKFRKVTRTVNLIGDPTGGGPCAWRTLMADITGGGRRAMEACFSEAADFRLYWRELFPNEEMPAVSFRGSSVIVIHLGEQRTNGFNVLVEGVAMTQRGLVVRYIKQTPAPGQRVKSVTTSPYVIITINERVGRATFESRTWSSDG